MGQKPYIFMQLDMPLNPTNQNPSSEFFQKKSENFELDFLLGRLFKNML
jgi:hypothetical protein